MPLIILLVVLAATFGVCGDSCQQGCLDGIRKVREATSDPAKRTPEVSDER